MKKNCINITFTLVLAFRWTFVSAQVNLPSKNQVFLPSQLLKEVLIEKDVDAINSSNGYGQKSTPSVKKFWVVYSDRDGNTTYSSPSGGSKCDELKFNETVRIAEIKGNYALVYTEPQRGVSYPTISSTAKSRGWVPMDHLLLWSTCPANEKGIYYKALLSANLDKAKGATTIGKLYKNPDATSDYSNLTTDMNFYFVMKRKGDLVLLSRQYKMEGNSDQVLLGWVSGASYVAWNQRSCLEPNWEPEVVENQLKGKSVSVFGEPNLSSPGASFVFGTSNGDRDHYSEYRMPAGSLRFPILDNDVQNNNIYKCSSFSTGGASISEISKWQETLNEGKKKATNEIESVNLIIAIDGTSSMGKYFPAVKSAIKNGITNFANVDQVKVGVVIYRDYADGEYITEVLPLCSPKEPRLSNFLDTGGKYGIKSSPKDRTHTEALYQGIHTAINPQIMGFTSKQSNLLLVVGDCGNDLTDNKIVQSSLLDAMHKNNFQVMSFQVRRSNSQEWLLFNQQMSQIVKGATDRMYKNLGAVKTKFTEGPDGYDLVPEDDHRFYTGTTRRASDNQEMEPSKLSALIQKNLGLFVEGIKTGVDVIQSFDFGGNTNVNSGTFAIDEAFVKSKVSAEFWDAAKRSNSIMTFKGYTPKKDSDGNPYWKPVIYISSSELDALLQRLVNVNNAAERGTATSDDRKAYINAVKGVLRSMVPDKTDAELDRMGNSEVMNMITGLNESTEVLRGPSLIDLSEPKVVSDDQFRGLVTDFSRKYKKLVNIKNSGYKYTLNVNNTRYYWIPMEDLP